MWVWLSVVSSRTEQKEPYFSLTREVQIPMLEGVLVRFNWDGVNTV